MAAKDTIGPGLFRKRLDIPRRQLLIPADVVDERIRDVGMMLNGMMHKMVERHQESAVLAGVLTGGVPFLMDLRPYLDPGLYRFGFLHTSSYGNAEVGGGVSFRHSTLGPVKGHPVILVDDIGDRRNTLAYLAGLMRLEEAAEIKTCVMLNKPERKEADIGLDLVCFNIANEFVWGRGLDGGVQGEETRNDPDVCYFADQPSEGTLYSIPTQFPQ